MLRPFESPRLDGSMRRGRDASVHTRRQDPVEAWQTRRTHSRHFRRLATRYDNVIRNFPGFVTSRAIHILLQ